MREGPALDTIQIELTSRTGIAASCALASGPRGAVWVAWTEFRDGKDAVFAAQLDPDTGQPILVEKVADKQITSFHPDIVCDAEGQVWLVWTWRRSRNDWRIMAARRTPDGWQDFDVSPVDMPVYAPRLAPDGRGGVHAVWEGFTDSAWGVFHRSWEGGAWSDMTEIGEPGLVCHRPSVAAADDGKVWVAYDGAHAGSSRIYVRTRGDGRWSETQQVSVTEANDVRPSLGIGPGNTVWVAWDRETVRWCHTRQINQITHHATPVLCQLGEGEARHLTTVQLQDDDFSGEDWCQMAKVLVDGAGAPWLLYRKYGPRPPGKWPIQARAFLGEHWGDAIDITGEHAGMKERISATFDSRGRLWAAWPEETLQDSWEIEVFHSWIHVRRKNLPDHKPPSLPALVKAPKHDRAFSPPLRHTVELDGTEHTLYWGELHMHSELSACERMRAREFPDQFRQYHDARLADFTATTDHDHYTKDYEWHRVRRDADLWNREGSFVVIPGYEWTPYNRTYGHYNVYFRTTEGARLYDAKQEGCKTPDELWQCLEELRLQGVEAFTIPHHPHCETFPVDFDYYGEEYEPLVELIQERGSYEYPGCFRAPRIEWLNPPVPGCSVRDALMKGCRLGFCGGTDFINARPVTAIYAPRLTRNDLFDALMKRRCYATSGEPIVIDFRVDGAFMGSELIDRDDEAERVIEWFVKARTPIRSVQLVRNDRDIGEWTDVGLDHTFRFVDRQPFREAAFVPARYRRQPTVFYYLRVILTNNEVGWSSPTWFRQT
ncbi:MAG: DUF3604 domain-containing protein [Nitrospiraceae bacterium]|nr:DUF3604 domain-containing protein [Nitrospiraceae bacterium]